jgi:hypothetical protein
MLVDHSLPAETEKGASVTRHTGGTSQRLRNNPPSAFNIVKGKVGGLKGCGVITSILWQSAKGCSSEHSVFLQNIDLMLRIFTLRQLMHIYDSVNEHATLPGRSRAIWDLTSSSRK